MTTINYDTFLPRVVAKLSCYLHPNELHELEVLIADTAYMQEIIVSAETLVYSDIKTMKDLEMYCGRVPRKLGSFGVYLAADDEGGDPVSRTVLLALCNRLECGAGVQCLIRTASGTRLITCCSSNHGFTDGNYRADYTAINAEGEKLSQLMQAGGDAWAEYKASMTPIEPNGLFKKQLLPAKA